LILGVYGYHDSGKTLFLEKLIKELRKRGISAAAIKHLGGHYEPDTQKDTGRLAKAGFSPVIGVAKGETIVSMYGKDDLTSAISLINRIAAPDVIFVEGFKNEQIEKIAVGDIKALPGTIFKSNEIEKIMKYIEKKVGEEREAFGCSCGCDELVIDLESDETMSDVELKLVVNGKKIAANEFVKNMVWETLAGMMHALKGVDKKIESIEISVKKE